MSATAARGGAIHPATSMGAVHLTIADLDRSIRFYTEHVGLRVRRRENGIARLGAGGPDLLVLYESPAAPRAQRTTGLYHFAILVPSRRDLARSLARFAALRTPMQGFSDHLVSEALYLADPDGNGIEVYRDRPRDEWPVEGGRLRMATDPLDVDSLLREASTDDTPWTGLARETRIGHVHLHVALLEDTEAFYTNVLGFDLMVRYGGSAIFLAAGGYHHHIGANTWAGVGAPRPPDAAIGLRHFEIVVPDDDALDEVARRVRDARVEAALAGGTVALRDPSGNGIVVKTPE